MIVTLALALAAASYPPTREDAERAVAESHFGIAGPEQASLDPGKPGFDLTASLHQCVRQESYEVPGPFGVIVLDAGHECVITISRRARPDYKVRGFFHHDGYGWRYYGPTGEPLVAETTTHGVGGGFSTRAPKPGSILYRGGSPGEVQDPYRRIFSGYDWFYEPAGQPPHDDIYTDK